MSTPSKIVASSLASSARGQLYRAAIVGAATLKGKEVAEMLNERNFPAVDVRLLDDDESIGQLEATGDEINFIQSVRAEQFTHVDFTFFAADAECTRQNWKRARDAGSAIIDLSGALEEEAGADVRSLWVERERGQNVAAGAAAGSVRCGSSCGCDSGFAAAAGAQGGRDSRARWRRFSSQRPSRDRRAWTSCTSKPSICCRSSLCPRMCSMTQVAFNMLARYGQKSKLSLDSLEARVRRHYQKIAGADAPQPALMVLQPPVFHGHALAIFLEMEQAVRSGTIVAGPGWRSRDAGGSGRRFAAEQREHGGSAEYSGFAEERSVAAQWNLAVGGR